MAIGSQFLVFNSPAEEIHSPGPITVRIWIFPFFIWKFHISKSSETGNKKAEPFPAARFSF